MKFKFDKEALTEVKAELNIKLPVKIRTRLYSGRYYGFHKLVDNVHYIDLFVSNNTSLRGANFVLWHELAHASQAERELARGAENFHKTYKSKDGEGGAAYLNNAYELEANQIAEANKERYLLERA